MPITSAVIRAVEVKCKADIQAEAESLRLERADARRHDAGGLEALWSSVEAHWSSIVSEQAGGDASGA